MQEAKEEPLICVCYCVFLYILLNEYPIIWPVCLDLMTVLP